MLQIVEVNDRDGNLVDIAHFCSLTCQWSDSRYGQFASYHPFSYETDYDVFCDNPDCKTHIQHGLSCWDDPDECSARHLLPQRQQPDKTLA